MVVVGCGVEVGGAGGGVLERGTAFADDVAPAVGGGDDFVPAAGHCGC